MTEFLLIIFTYLSNTGIRPSLKSTAMQTSPELKRVTLHSNDPDKDSIISDLLYCGEREDKSQVQGYSNPDETLSKLTRPKQEPPKIRFSEQNQYISNQSLSVSQQQQQSQPTNTDRTMSSDSMETLDNQGINYNYNYYTTPYSMTMSEENRKKNGNNDERKYLCKDCARKDTYKWNPEHLRTTISEESLSGCSASESSTHEYKIKNITIKIGKPYYL